MGINYFWDSYSIIEFVDGNLSFEKYKDKKVTITVFNLTEIYYSFLRVYSEKEADELYERYKSCVVKIDDKIIKEAMQFRKKNKERKLSYADCIGYIYALRNDLNFLTGDKQFEDLDGVEFIR